MSKTYFPKCRRNRAGSLYSEVKKSLKDVKTRINYVTLFKVCPNCFDKNSICSCKLNGNSSLLQFCYWLNFLGVWLTIKGYRRRPRTLCPVSTVEWEYFYANIYPPPSTTKLQLLPQDVPKLDALGSAKTEKTPGPDGLSNGFLKGLPANWKYYTLRLFNKVLESGEVPDNWCQTETKMIDDDDSQKRTLSTTGRLPLPIPYRNFSVAWWRNDSALGARGSCRRGFRPFRACEDHIFVLTAKMAEALFQVQGSIVCGFYRLQESLWLCLTRYTLSETP